MEKQLNRYWKITKFIFLGIFGIITVIIIWASIDWYTGEDPFLPQTKTEVVYLQNKNIKLYIKTRTWGLAGNHEQIFITKTNKGIYPDSLTDIVFNTDVICYKIINDSLLLIYSPSEPFAYNLKNNYIKIITVNGGDSLRDLTYNFKNYGLKRIRVYSTN